MTIHRILPRRADGFTLTEILVAMVIVGILASLAAPSFKDLMLNQRIKSASFDMTAALTLARSEAIKQNGKVTLTPASGTSAWAGGWTIEGPDGATIGTQGAFAGGITITGPTSVVYNRTGRSDAAATVTLELASTASGVTVPARCLSIGVTGQPKSVKGGC